MRVPVSRAFGSHRPARKYDRPKGLKMEQPHDLEIFIQSQFFGDRPMRKLIFTCIAATLVAAPMTTIVKAEDTTIIKRDRDGEGDKTVIKKREELKVLPVPHTEEKTIIKKERD